MKLRTFTSGQGTTITTSNSSEIKRMKACGWKEVKNNNQVYAKGLENGKPFLN